MTRKSKLAILVTVAAAVGRLGLRHAPVGTEAENDAGALAERFLAANLQHPAETFHAILAWDGLPAHKSGAMKEYLLISLL